MKPKLIVNILVCTFFLFAGCNDDSVTEPVNEDETQTGTLQFKTLNPMAGLLKSELDQNSVTSNPPLTGPTTITETTSLLLGIGDVWVSQEEVKVGEPDDLEWIKLTGTTNTELKLFEDYSFAAVDVPEGTYKSIKIIFRNVFYRYAKLVSDPSVTYELLETMGSYSAPCDENDLAWARTNYFGPDGNHGLDGNNLFEMVSEVEKIGGFTLEAGQTAVLSWRLWAGATEPCTTFLIDENDNLQWDCGVDRMDFDCPPDVEYMWDFVIEYE
jgi:hypothetical protein